LNTIDLDKPPPNHRFQVTIEREETIPERRVRLFREVSVFVLAIAFVVTIAWICVRTLTSPEAPAEEKKWAMSVLSAATGGIIGYLLRR
jgi:hypothetical protein